MLEETPRFSVRLATKPHDLSAAHRLRYRVFVEELGGDGPLVDHVAKEERDRLDPFFDHLVLVDERKIAADRDHVAGVYRIMTSEAAARAGQFYSQDEFDLSQLIRSGRRLMELGRSCVDARYRGGAAIWHLWSGLARYVLERDIEVLFGVASFHGTDIARMSAALSLLHQRHLAPEQLRVRALGEHRQAMDLMHPDAVDPALAMKEIPALIKSYLRLGGYVGEGAFIDHAFNTTDVCLVLDVERMSPRQRNLLIKGR